MLFKRARANPRAGRAQLFGGAQAGEPPHGASLNARSLQFFATHKGALQEGTDLLSSLGAKPCTPVLDDRYFCVCLHTLLCGLCRFVCVQFLGPYCMAVAVRVEDLRGSVASLPLRSVVEFIRRHHCAFVMGAVGPSVFGHR